MKKYDSSVTEVWVRLNFWSELPPEQYYEFSIALILNNKTSEAIKESLTLELETLVEGNPDVNEKKEGIVKKQGLRGCLNGIEVDEYYVLNKHEFSRDDMDSYSLFNLDYISHSSGNEIPKFR